MTEIDLSLIDRALYLQARAFQLNKQHDQVTGQGGWGQFLNLNPARIQIGTYGTSSGTIVLLNSGSELDVLSDVKEFFLKIWNDEAATQERAGRRFSQNLKLFIYFLAVSKLPGPEFLELRKVIKEEISARQLASGLWGDWWIKTGDHDPIEKLFTSSIGLLCLTYSGAVDRGDLLMAAKRLANLVSYSSDIPPSFLSVALSALAPFHRDLNDPRLESSLKDLVWSDPTDVNAEALYIYEYKHLKSGGATEWKTEIFSFPQSLLLAIAALQFQDQIVFNIFCRNTAERLTQMVIDHDGMLPSDAEMRTHCMPQLWCSLFLTDYRKQMMAPNWVQKFMFKVVSPQSRSTLLYKVLPVLAAPALAVLNVIIPESETGWRVLVSFSTVMIAGVWGPDVVRRWLPGGR